MFFAYHMDMKARTINLIGFSGTVQHYVDDGKGPPPAAQGGAMLNPGAGPGNLMVPLVRPPNGINPVELPNIGIIRRRINIAPIVVPEPRK
jgi:hypothetical protein